MSTLLSEISLNLSQNGPDSEILQSLTGIRCLINILESSTNLNGTCISRTIPECTNIFREILVSKRIQTQNDHVVFIIQQVCATIRSQVYFESPDCLNGFLCDIFDIFLHDLRPFRSGFNDIDCIEERIVKFGAIFKQFSTVPNFKTAQNLQNKFKELSGTLMDMMKHANGRICSIIVYETLPQIEDNLSEVTKMASKIWKVVCQFFSKNHNDCLVEDNPNGYLILCGIADKLFPSTLNPDTDFFDVRKISEFWLIMQHGLVHTNPTTRKASMHLFKRALQCSYIWTALEVPFLNTDSIFWWLNTEARRLKQYYEDLILILETLEEKQVHVIKPVLPRLVALREAARLHLRATCENNSFYLHSSWLLVVFERMMKHENTNLKKLGISEITTVDLDSFPLFAQKMEKFVFQVLVPSLNDISLFVRQQDEALNSCPMIGENVAHFFANCYKTQDPSTRKTFFKKVLRCMCQQSWSSVPLLYMCRGLALLPKDSFWASDDLAQLRELVVISSRTQEIPIRTAIQHYVLRSLITSTDTKSAPVEDLVYLLAAFNRAESLHRGTSIWDHITEWIGDLCVANEWKQMVVDFCNSSFDVNEHGMDAGNPQSTIRFACLVVDAKVISISKLKSLFEPIIYTLQTTSGRCYMPTDRVDNCLRYLMYLWHESNQKLVNSERESDELNELSKALLDSCHHQVLDFIVKRIFGDRKNVKMLPDFDLYFQFLDYEAKQGTLPTTPELTSQIEIDIIQKYVHVKWLALRSEYILRSPSSSEFSKNHTLDIWKEMIRQERLAIPLPSVKLDSASELDLANWAKRVTDHQSNLWTCAKLYFQNRQGNNYINSVVLQSTTALDTAGLPSLNAIFGTLELVLPQVFEEDLIREVLNNCWKCIFEYKRSKTFWVALRSLICTMYQPRFISHPFDQMLEEFAVDLFKRSDTCNGLFLPLVQHVCGNKLQIRSVISSEAFLTIIVHALTFGPVHRKDQKVFRDTIDFLSSSETDNMLELIESHHLDHLQVRVTAICFLLKLDPLLESHVKFTDHVLEKLINDEKRATQSRSRHFGNSYIHRIKTRCWQSILLISPFMSQERSEWVYDVAVQILVEESLQTSVRYLIEWLISRILFRFNNLMDVFWETLRKASEKRVGSLAYFFNVIRHVMQLGVINETFNIEEFSLRVFIEIFPWCLSQHSSTRISAQMLFLKLWEVNELLSLTANLDRFETVRHGLESAIKFGCHNKSSQKSQDDFYGSFHPNDHFTIQTVFYELPRLSNLTDEEWLAPGLFTRSLQETRSSHFIPVVNLTNELSKCKPSTCFAKYGEMDTLNTFDDSEPRHDFGDVQKKITPWKEMWNDPEVHLSLSDFQIAKKKPSKDGGLIVVASLVDRAPNLGGLCRTCEVLGASEFVLNSLKTLQEKQFNNLSVSSEKWLPIREVKTRQLKQYLNSMKHCGYTLIGAEQTAQSVPLNTLQFPPKTLLLLGSEKEGIPVDLIQMLDVCVEIPQTGVIRSLNVHVSGAILIWEYARQHP